MSSNEEYLDSLLKAVTTGDTIDIEESSDSDGLYDEAADESMSQDMLSQMVANVENLDIDAEHLENNGLGFNGNNGGAEDEKAFVDPGALFFEGEEDDEYADEELYISDNIEEDTEDFADDLEGYESTKAEENSTEENSLVDDISLEHTAATEEEFQPEIEDVTEMSEADEAAVEGNDMDVKEESDDLFTLEDLQEEEIPLPDSLDMEDLGEAGVEDELEEGFKEINDLLASSGEDEEDMFAMLENMNGSDEEPADIGIFGEEAEEEIPEKKKKRKKSRKEKAQQTEEDTEEASEGMESLEGKEKKIGFFAKFINFLTEEDEEEQEEGILTAEEQVEEFQGTEVNDENAAILNDLEKEDSEEDKKKKKEKKGKKGKGKKEAAEETEGEGTEGEAPEGKKRKKEKKKKIKAESLENEKPAKKLSVKKIEVIAIFCITLLAAVLLSVYLVPGALENAGVRDAYYDKDYKAVVEGFYGKALEDSDELMYNRALVVMKMQRKVDGYNNYVRMGKEAEALNQLIEGIFRYEEIYPEAQEYNVTAEIDGIYQTIIDALQNGYGLSVADAKELYNTVDNFEYTLKLEAVVNGTEYVAPVLPEENGETVPENAEDNNLQPETAEQNEVQDNAASEAADGESNNGQETEPQSDLLPEEEELQN